MKLNLIKNPNPQEPPKKLLILELAGDDRIPYSELLEEFNVIKAAKEGFHIVTIAYIGLTQFSSICEFAYGLDQYEQEKIIAPINSNKETGTIYPKHNLTVLPYRYRTTPVMTIGEYDYTKGKGYDINEVEKQILDAFKAELEYVKSKKIVLDLRDLGKEMLRYRNLIHRFLTDKFSEMDWEVYMYSYDNSEWKK